MLNLDSKAKSKAAWVGAMLAPVIVVQCVRSLVVGDPSPTTAAATMISVALPAAAQEAPKELTAAQEKAAAWLRSRAVTLNLRSPMDRMDPPAAPVVESEPVRIVETRPAPSPAPDTTPHGLRLTGILGGGSESSRSLASINHRIYRVGDEVSTGWKVASIDSKARTVVLEGPNDKTIVLMPPMP